MMHTVNSPKQQKTGWCVPSFSNFIVKKFGDNIHETVAAVRKDADEARATASTFDAFATDLERAMAEASS